MCRPLADVSLAGHRVTQSIPVGSFPKGVAIRSDGLEAAVAHLDGSVRILNLTNDSVKTIILDHCFANGPDIAYTQNGLGVILPTMGVDCISPGLVWFDVAVANPPRNWTYLNVYGQGVAAMPNGDSALLTAGVLGTSIRRIHLTPILGTVTIPNTSSSFGVAVAPDSSQAVVTSAQGDTVKRINLPTNTVTATIPFESNQSYHNVAITPDGSQAIVVGDFTTALISIKNDSIVMTYPDGGSNVAISPDGRFAYISAYASGNVVLVKVIRIPALGVPTALNLIQGWNLAGNSNSATLDVATTLNDPSKIISVWKWVPGTSKWAFYAPSMTSTVLAAYVANKGYDALSTVAGGEGFWVNAQTAFSATLPTGTAVTSASFATTLGSGWSLISIGDSKTPRAFNNSLSATSPSAGTVAAPMLTTLWAWNSTQSAWYFYEPSLDNSSGLAGYTASKGYLDFGTGTLAPGTGFWVNKP